MVELAPFVLEKFTQLVFDMTSTVFFMYDYHSHEYFEPHQISEIERSGENI